MGPSEIGASQIRWESFGKGFSRWTCFDKYQKSRFFTEPSELLFYFHYDFFYIGITLYSSTKSNDCMEHFWKWISHCNLIQILNISYHFYISRKCLNLKNSTMTKAWYHLCLESMFAMWYFTRYCSTSVWFIYMSVFKCFNYWIYISKKCIA